MYKKLTISIILGLTLTGCSALTTAEFEEHVEKYWKNDKCVARLSNAYNELSDRDDGTILLKNIRGVETELVRHGGRIRYYAEEETNITGEKIFNVKGLAESHCARLNSLKTHEDKLHYLYDNKVIEYSDSELKVIYRQLFNVNRLENGNVEPLK